MSNAGLYLEADGGASQLLFVPQSNGTVRVTSLPADAPPARFAMTHDHMLALRDFADRWLKATEPT